MTAIISNLMELIARFFQILVQFLIVLLLGLVVAILFILPWLLRIAAILLWTIGSYAAMSAVQNIYSPYSSTGEVIALKSAVILVAISIVMLAMLSSRNHVWGSMAVSGILTYGLSYGAKLLIATWAYADLFFRVLPPALLAVGMIVMTLRLKAMRTGGQIQFSASPFVWFKSLRGGDAQSPK